MAAMMCGTFAVFSQNAILLLFAPQLERSFVGRDPYWGILDPWVNNNLQRFLCISIRTCSCMRIWLFNLSGKLLHMKLHLTTSKCRPWITPDLRWGVAQSHEAQPCLSSHGISFQKDSPPPTRCRAGLVPASPIHLRTNAPCEYLSGKQCAIEISLQAIWKKKVSLLRAYAISHCWQKETWGNKTKYGD